MATVAAQPSTTSPSEMGKRAAALETQSSEELSPEFSDRVDAALSIAPVGADVAETVTEGTERLSSLTRTVAETSLGDGTPELLLAAGYSRWSQSSALENDTREALYESVREAPGSYLSELAAELDLSVSTVRYHARILENNRIVTVAETSGKHRLYPVGGSDPTLLAALDEEATARVLHGLHELGPVTVADLASELGLADSTVSYHLSRLDDDGLVTRERRGRTVLTELRPSVESVVGEDADAVASE
jgi:DNA-binding transcriptional ArsR family regulator